MPMLFKGNFGSENPPCDFITYIRNKNVERIKCGDMVQNANLREFVSSNTLT